MGIAHPRALSRNTNIQPDIVVECPDEYSIVALVRESFGIALMPRTDILELCSESLVFTRLKDLEHLSPDLYVLDERTLPASGGGTLY